MPTEHAAAWNRHSGDDAYLSTEAVQYGPDIPSEAELRLLGIVEAKRVLELGCGRGHALVAMARQGARAIGVEPSAERLNRARLLAQREAARVELHRADLADLAFVRADSIDLVLSVYAFNHVEDLNRVFRQAHRVLHTGAPLVFSVPHPAYDMIDDDDPVPPFEVRRPYFDREPVRYSFDGSPATDYHRTVSDLATSLVRANFSIDTVAEPEPVAGAHSPFWRPAFAYVPRTLIFRARKQGI